MPAGAFITRVLSLLLALCLLIAPLCSARCAVNSCLPMTAPAPSSGCHHHPAGPPSNSVSAVAPSCQASDVLLTTVPLSVERTPRAITAHAPAAPFSDFAGIAAASGTLPTPRFDYCPGTLVLSSAAPLRL